MNDTFAGRSPEGGEESKATATKRILKDFIGQRPHDLVGVAAFSTSPMLVMPLTDHHDAVRAAIDARATGPGSILPTWRAASAWRSRCSRPIVPTSIT